MLLFVIINPDLKYPYQIELEKAHTGSTLSVLERLISRNEKPAHSDHYCMQHAVNCLRLRKLYDQIIRSDYAVEIQAKSMQIYTRFKVAEHSFRACFC